MKFTSKNRCTWFDNSSNKARFGGFFYWFRKILYPVAVPFAARYWRGSQRLQGTWGTNALSPLQPAIGAAWMGKGYNIYIILLLFI